MKRFIVTLAILAAALPRAGWCQPPALIETWNLYPVIFGHPTGIAVAPNGDVYVAHLAAHIIQALTSDGTSKTLWGSYGQDPWSITGPMGVAVDSHDHVFVAEASINTPATQSGFQVFTSAGTYVTSWGTFGWDLAPGVFQTPLGVAVGPDSRVYVVDADLDRVQVFTNEGVFITQWRTPLNPYGVAVDVANNVIVSHECGIQKYTSSGTELARWGSNGTDPGQFNNAAAVAVDPGGNVYVADTWNDRIQVFTTGGAFITQWGGRGGGPAQFSKPQGLAVDGSGRVYVADTWNNRIQVFAPLPREVRLDVRPGDDDNVVNRGANGVLPVAIMSEPHFDATTVDPLTVQLSGARVRVRPNGQPTAWSRDLDGDGRADLLLHIETGELALASGDTVAHLTGQGPNHLVVRGSARVRVVGGEPRQSKPQTQPLSSTANALPSLRAQALPDGRVLAWVRLAVEGPARLDLIDVAGRRLETVCLGGPVDGQEYALGPRELAPGIYWVRVEQAGRVSTARVAAVR